MDVVGFAVELDQLATPIPAPLFCDFAKTLKHRRRDALAVAYEPKPNGKNAEVGIDLGLKEGMTLSTGAKVENSRMFAKYEDALRCAQRAGKKRRTQAIHAKIANSRKDLLHKETTKIADAFGLICVGNVSGRWLQATNGKSSADASTGMSRNMLRYKAIARAAMLVDTLRIPQHSGLFRMRKRRRSERTERLGVSGLFFNIFNRIFSP